MAELGALLRSANAPAGPFWEMLALLAREPSLGWLHLGAAEQPCGERGAAGTEPGCSPKHSLGPRPLQMLSLLECSGDSGLWQAYLEGLKTFLDFRERMGMPAAWPIPEEQVRGFLAVESHGPCPEILMCVAALSYASRLTGNPDPLEDPITRSMVIGLKRRAGILRDKCLAITIEVLRSLLGVLETVCVTHYECLLFRALFTAAFFGGLRTREIVAKNPRVLQRELLYLSDLQLMERRVVFSLRSSAVDEERHVISLGLSGEPWVCPVLALHSYVAARSRLAGPLFVCSDNRAVTKRDFLTVLRGALELLGLRPEQYSVHSFWLGAAVTAARCGLPGEEITRLTRWPCMVPMGANRRMKAK